MSYNPEIGRPVYSSRQSQQYVDRGYAYGSDGMEERNANNRNSTGGIAVNDFSPVAQTNSAQQHGKFHEDWDASQRGSSIIDGDRSYVHRTPSVMSHNDQQVLPKRGGTLKKKASLRRSGSRRSSRAGSVRSLALQPEPTDEMHSAFYTPVPTSGHPTEYLANRFMAWRKLLKDLIAYFREVQTSYDHRQKSILKLSNLTNNIVAPNNFLLNGGLNDAMQMLNDFHKQSMMEAGKARSIEEDVIQALTGLRSDLQTKIKEIKGLSGDFKNSVDKEMDQTRKAVRALGDALGQSDIDPSQMTGKQDPYLLRLAVDRQLERQIDEENYLHQAYLNLETSGRELEAIVVGEIQKAYSAYSGILKREADETYNTVENLRTGPIAMPKDYEWHHFIETDDRFVSPDLPIRRIEQIHYAGRDHELAQEVRAGLLERKSKYLKSYTAGWYVLSPTHLHEFKTADKSQAPIMSLYLPEQKLGSHSTEGSSSNKFMLKGRQTGSLHRGHSWVFRAESYDTMMAWYEDIKSLTEAAPQERNAFVRSHARSFSGNSHKASSISSDGVMDEEDEEPFSTDNSAVVQHASRQETKRPEPGGRFPSDIQVNPTRGLQVPLSSSSVCSIGNQEDRDAISAAADLPGSGVGEYYPATRLQPQRSASYGHGEGDASHAIQLDHNAQKDGLNPYTYQPLQKQPELKAPSQVERAQDESAGLPHVDSTTMSSIVAANTLFNAQSAGKSAEVANNYLPQQVVVEKGAPAHDNKLTSATMNDTDSYIAGRDDFLPVSVKSSDQLGPIPSVATCNVGPERPLQHDERTTAPTAALPETSIHMTTVKPAGHVHEQSSRGSSMHIPGEFPEPTPLEEDASIKYA